jgi:hypothetical protein
MDLISEISEYGSPCSQGDSCHDYGIEKWSVIKKNCELVSQREVEGG